MIKLKHKMNELLSKNTNNPIEKVEKDTERDYFMSAIEAKEYGIIDKIIEKAS